VSYQPKKCPHCDDVFDWGDRAATPHDEKSRTSFNAHWLLTWHMQDKHPEQFFTCGRQGESLPGLNTPGAYWDDQGKCSYCGSLKPDIVLMAIENGTAILGATDKNYKLYVELPNPNEGRLVPLSSRSFPPDEGEEGWIEATPENCKLHGFLPWASGPSWFKLSPESALTHDKFYFQHFTAEQQLRFVDLYNEGRMRFRGIGGIEPRGFYRLPFFMKVVPTAGAAEAAA
jgi:hypothetical protein